MNAQCRIAMEETTVARTVKPPPRPIPEDFEVVFVEQGRLECEAWYRARRTTVNRWLEESGKQRLIDKRAEFVRHLRDKARPAPAPVNRSGIRDRRRVSRALAMRAANYLRCVRNGGWAVAPMSGNEWLVGTRRRSAAELIDLACAKGFDRRRANLQIRAEGGED
jgi:hypothetical protein